MNNQDKIKEVEKAIDNDLYKLIDEIDAETFTSDYDTNELADILNDYMTDVQPELTSDLLAGPLDDIKIEHQSELNLAVDESQLIKEYDEHLTHLGDKTLNEFRESDKELFAEIEEVKRVPEDELDQAILMLEERTKELSEEFKNKRPEETFIDEEEIEDVELTNTIISPATFSIDEEDIKDDEEFITKTSKDDNVVQDTMELILENQVSNEVTQVVETSEVEGNNTIDIIEQLTTGKNTQTLDVSQDLSTLELNEFKDELEKNDIQQLKEEEVNNRKKLAPFDYFLIVLIIVCAVAAAYLFFNR